MKKQILALINDETIFVSITKVAFIAGDTDRSGLIDKEEFKKYAINIYEFQKSFLYKEFFLFLTLFSVYYFIPCLYNFFFYIFIYIYIS